MAFGGECVDGATPVSLASLRDIFPMNLQFEGVRRILAIQGLNTGQKGGHAKSLAHMLHYVYFLAFCRPHEVLAFPMIA